MTQVEFLPMPPPLLLVMIALDVVVLFSLTIRWEESQRISERHAQPACKE